MRTALLALALSPTLAVVPCSSDKPDDVDTEGCYGWCSAAFAADHCGWCRCKGCNFCRSSAKKKPKRTPKRGAPRGEFD